MSAQLRALRDYADKNDQEVVREFVDEAESGRVMTRPEFQKVIEEAKRTEASFNEIFVWKFSRFTRKREHAVVLKSMLRRKGLRVVSITEQAEDNPTGRLLQGIIETVDEFYSENLSRMAAILSTVEDPTGVDYLWESTNLIHTMLQDNLMEGEDLPVWAEATTASDLNGRALELKHKQMASRLIRNRFTPHFPPASGYWAVTGEHILIGVESVKSILRDTEVQDHWVDREANHGGRNVLYHLYRSEIE